MKTIKRIVRKIFLWLHIDVDSYRPRKEYVVDQKKLVPKPHVIFDVGGHIGLTVLKYRQMYPSATIYSFEPFKGSFNVLEKRCSTLNNCEPFNLAFSESKGRSDFFVPHEGGGTNSMFQPEDMEKRSDHDNDVYYGGTEKTSVDTDTIDSFCREKNINKIDILKMDTQGGELLVLRGAEKMLTEQKISLVFLEISFIYIYKKQALFHEIESFMVSHGYTLYNLHYMSTSSHGQLVQGDAIFVNKETAKQFE